MKLDKLCCLFSKLAYKSGDELVRAFGGNIATEYSCIKSYAEPKFYSSSKGAQCFVTSKDGQMFITFRGTDSIRDWLTDVNIVRVPMDLPHIPDSKRPRVHWGFLRQFRSLQPMLDKDIHTFIAELSEENKTGELIISGHSLGGAESCIAGLQFALAYPTLKIKCFSYGSPRVGCSDFVKMFEKHVGFYKRYVNEDDPVTMIPFAWRFKHLPKLDYLDAHNKILHKTETTWWRIICDSFLSLFGRESPVGDHSCDKYLDKMNKCYPSEVPLVENTIELPDTSERS